MEKRGRIRCILALLFVGMAVAVCSESVAQELPSSATPAMSSVDFDRVAFLEFLNSSEAPDEKVLKEYYRRPKFIPLRDLHWLKNAEEMRRLGQKIFFDPRLSRTGMMSCSSCHNPMLKWTDGLPKSPENDSRRSMSLYNLAWDRAFLWNARAGSLMSQSALAISAKKGMDLNLQEVAGKLNSIKGYQPLFKLAFSLGEDDTDPATLARTAAAIEVFVSTIVSAPSAFDRWIAGDEEAISERAKSGFLLFNGKAKCAQCHNSWRFSDGQIYNTGLQSQCDDAKKEQTKTSWNNGLFKAVGLREIGARPPYMHDGSLGSLREVVEFYNRGGDTRCGVTSKHLTPLGLSASQIEDLVQFLETLGGAEHRYVLPELPK